VRRWLLIALVALPVRGLAAQEPAAERTVTAVTFRGNHALDATTLAAAIYTSSSTWTNRWPVLRSLALGTRRVFDELEFRRDVIRLQIFYRQHGYFDARVDTAVARTPTSVSVTFLIEEGPPVVVDSIAVHGLDSILDVRRLVRRLPLAEGKPFDRIAFADAADTIVLAVQNLGYPFAGVYRNYSVHRETRRAEVEYAVVPGPRARFGDVTIAGVSAVSPATVRRFLAVRPGDWFNQDAVYESQRSLYQSDLFRYVSVGVAPPSLSDSGASAADSVVPLIVQVTEAPPSRFRAGVGYGTIDCFRSQATLTTANFLGGGRRLDLAGKLSKVGVGAPTNLGLSESICKTLEDDPFSERVNYLTSATLTQPAFLHRRATLTLTAFAERRSEYKAFEHNGVGASLALAYGLSRSSQLTMTYRLDYGSTKADTAVYCVYFERCLPSAVALLSEPHRQAVLSLSFVRNTANSPLEPSAGSVLLIEGSHASPLVGSEPLISYNKLVAEWTWYAALARSWIVALRLRGGVIRPGLAFVADSSIRYVPPEERFYAGGPASVRGFGRNEMGPLVYVADSVKTDSTTGRDVPYGLRTSPLGSYAIALANLELRFPSPIWGSRLRLAAFVDVGELWDETVGRLIPAGLRITPGVGLRVGTPLGPLRVDVAYNDYPRQPGPLFVASPPVGKVGGQLQLWPRPYPPPGTTVGGSFFKQLQFQFSVGEAF
jgi:outer membrane protein assembly complex protein YaeT